MNLPTLLRRFFGFAPAPDDAPVPVVRRPAEPRPVPAIGPAPDSVPPRSSPGRFFSWGEFERSTAAARLDVDNAVPPQHQAAVMALCAMVLDPVRARTGRPVRITSGYRVLAVNTEVHGSRTSQHMVGEAADIKAEGYTAETLARLIVDVADDFDQVIWYDPDRGGHVHVSYTTTRPNRRQTLHAPAAGGYVAWVAAPPEPA